MIDIKSQFPILRQKVWGHPLVYLDNAATTQKPQSVIDTIVEYYTEYNSNVHRGVHYLSQKATDREEEARSKVAGFINAASPEEILFTKGTTDGINLLAQSLCRTYLEAGDEILLTEMEHHSNIVPWYIIAEQMNLKVKFIPLTRTGELDKEAIPGLITEKTKIVSLTWVSNTLGTVNDIDYIAALARSRNAMLVVDAAQAVQHLTVDVQASGIDFLVASGHKMYGPTGIGFVYGRRELLDRMLPYQGGGSMIKSVTTSGFTAHDVPYRFEAGTPHIEGIIGLGAAVDFIRSVGLPEIEAHEKDIMTYSKSLVHSVDGVHILGENDHQSGTLSLIFERCHPADVGELIDKKGVAVRVGQHCCQPVMDYFDVPATLRLSFAAYTSREDVDAAFTAIAKAMAILS